MNGTAQHKTSPEELLKKLEDEQQQFKNHWVWKELNCTPNDFFEAVQKHVDKMDVPPEKWRAAYEKVKRANEIKAIEQRPIAKPINIKMLAAIRV